MKRLFIFLALSLFSVSTFASDLDSANRLAADDIIVQKSSSSEYRLNDNVLRQEVIGTAVKLAGVNLPENYSCQNYFSDLTNASPNTWACRAFEISADNGFVSRANDRARPEDPITRAEALAIVMSTGDYAEGSASIQVDSSANDWQAALLRRAVSAGVLESATSFGPNTSATRGEVFRWADAVKNGTTPSTNSGSSEDESSTLREHGLYLDYTGEEQFASNDRVILFFHAGWCTVCVAADKNIRDGIQDLPDNITILKVNFDRNDELRERYEVAARHTFVEVDSNGNLVAETRGAMNIEDLLADLASAQTDSASSQASFSVSGGNYFFEPNVIEVKKGTEVTINFSSEEGFHDWVVDEFEVATDAISSGNTTTVTFTPDQVGEFEFYCSIGFHRAQGMVGTLRVVE